VERYTTTTRHARCYVLSSGYRMGSRHLCSYKPYAPCVVKPWEVVINVTPLCCTCGVLKLSIFLINLLSAFIMLTQELGLLSCCEPSSQPRNGAKIPCHPHRSPSVSLFLLASDLTGLVLVISIIIISTILFPLVSIIATLGALVKVYIISTEQYTTVLACMDFFNLYSKRTDYLLRLIYRLCYLVSFR
jgi:hypothetical protein